MPQNAGATLEFSVHFQKGRKGRQQLLVGERPVDVPLPQGRIPRISKLMALAIKMDGMVQRGEVHTYTELATIGRVSRPRITQIMNLLILAPEIQDELLHLPPVENGRDPIRPRQLIPLLRTAIWSEQRKLWEKTKQACSQNS